MTNGSSSKAQIQPDPIHSLPEYILGLARLGSRVAVVERGLFRRTVFTYSDLIARATAFASWLRGNGIEPGDRVMLWGESGAAWAAAYYGGILARAVLVPLDAGFSLDLATKVQRHTEARLICTDHPDPKWPGIACLTFDEILALPSPLSPSPGTPPDPSDLVQVVYTSGATGEPRGVMITHGNLLANLRPVAREIHKYRRLAVPFLPVRFLHLIPLSHLFGQVMGLLIPPLLEGCVVYSETKVPAQWAAIIRDERISVMVCVPQEIAVMSQWALGRINFDESAVLDRSRGRGVLRRMWLWRRLHRTLGWKMWAFVVGGAALAPEIEELWVALGYAVLQGYGLTETAPAVTITHPFKIRRGAVGRKLAGMDLKLAPDGEILVRGDNVSPGYYRDPAASDHHLTDGWLHTGDLGQLDEQGNLRILGRKKEVIVTADGLNVYPVDVERALNAQPDVLECAVVESAGIGGPQVHAVIVLEPDRAAKTSAALDRAVANANAALEPHQRVRATTLWPGDRLPRTASTHKLQRLAIAAWVRQGGGGRPATAPADTRPQDWREFVSRRWGIDPSRLTDKTRVDTDLGLSSLDRVELLTWIEAHPAAAGRPANIDEGALTAAQTVADLESVASGRAPAVPPVTLPVSGWPWRQPALAVRRFIQATLILPLLRIAVSRVTVEGLSNLEGINGPVLFISNHQSMLDVPVILRALPRSWRRRVAPAMGVVLLGQYPDINAPNWRRLRSWFRCQSIRLVFGTYLLTERAGISAALRRTGNLLDRGFCPLIFPEGARTRDGRVHDFRPGIGVFVENLRVPVVPIYIEGLFEVLPVTRPSLHRGAVRVRIGSPLLFPDDPATKVTASLASTYVIWEQVVAN